MTCLRLNDEVRSFELTFMDCDGVIFDVNTAKSAAFGEALEGYPAELQAQFVAHHKAFGGVSRYAKFERFFREIHPVDDVDAAVKQALARFGERSRQAYMQLQPRTEALEFASHMGGAERCYVVSGSDQRELRGVFDAHGLSGNFAAVHGSPTKKGQHLRELLYERGVPASRALMVGDGRADFEAARELGLAFVFLREMSEWQAADEHLDPAARHFNEAGVGLYKANDWAELLSWRA